MEKYTGLEIAVIGMSGRFPGAMNLKAFWDNLKNGSESISFFSDEELINEGEDPNLVNNPLYVKAYSFLQNKEYFDSAFFNYRPDEAGLMDPQIRIFHECVWEAIEDAGCDLNDLKNKIGLFAGSSGNLNWEVYAKIINANELVDDFTLFQLSNARLLSSRISYFLNLKGPSIYLDSACSTSLVAIHQACKSLLTADCNIAIAGGVTIFNKSRKGYLYNSGLINSCDGHCRPFDADSTGTIGGEGAGVIVLKTLKHALRDGDNIHAIIKGSGITNDGSNKVGFTAPSVEGQVEAIMMAQKWARVDPQSITYIETHGTATKLGDPIEVEALNRVFGESKEKYCILGSGKSNIGHLDAAAGVAGFIKTVLAIKHQQIPPTLHFKNPNPSINFKDSPFYINTQLEEWKRNGSPLRAGVSSFGIGGTNAHVILEEAPERSLSSESRKHKLLIFSGKTPEALERNSKNFRDYLNENAREELSNIAFTLQVGRMSFPYRRAVVCSDRTEALEKLSSRNSNPSVLPVESNGKYTVIFMFSGQGSQYLNMCRDLYFDEFAFREEADKCFDIVKRLSRTDLKSIVFTEKESQNPNEINNTEFTQPLIFIMEYALSQLMKKWGINPDVMIGHSIGEYTAACLSGLFSLEDALLLVMARGKLMQRAPIGAMMSISISEKELNPLLAEHKNVSLAAINSSSLCVVSGLEDSIGNFKIKVEELGYKTQLLRTSHAFHSDLMDGVLDEFERTVMRIKIKSQQIPFISNLTGRQALDSEVSKPQYWVNHLRQTVKFSEGIEALFQKNKKAIFIEVGPGKSLSTLVRNNIQRSSSHKVVSLVRHPNETISDSAHVLSALGELWCCGLKPDWNGFYEKQHHRKVSLPTYAFEKIKYPVNVDSSKMIAEMVSVNLVVKDPDFSKWFYVPSWKLAPPLFQSLSLNEDRCTLLFADDCGIADSIIARFKAKGQRFVCVSKGERFHKQTSALYTINPFLDDGYKELFSELLKDQLVPDCIVHGWGIAVEQSYVIDEAEKDKIQFLSLLEIIRACQLEIGLDKKQFVLLTSGLHPVLGKTEVSSRKSLALGILKVLSEEYRTVSTNHIDICLSEMKSHELTDDLYNEITDHENKKNVSLRNSLRWKQIYERIRIPEVPFQNLRKGGVYMITGGLGKFGFIIANHLIEKLNAKIILLGRTVLPPQEEWTNLLMSSTANAGLKIKVEKLLELDKKGQVMYLNCNIAEVEEVANVINIGEQKFGLINGVIHAAGIVSGESINSMIGLSKSDFENQFAPKIEGLHALEKVFGSKHLDFCLITSSLSAVLGGIGLGAYATANLYMDYYIKSCHDQGRLKNWVSVNLDRLEFNEKSAKAINAEELIAVFERVLAVKGLPQIIVSICDLNKKLEKDELVKSELRFQDNGPQPIALKNNSETVLDTASLLTTENALIQVWQNFFGKSQIDVTSNFFEIGGDSLKALTMIGRIHKTFNVNVSIKEFFNRPSVIQLSEYINLMKEASGPNSGYTSIPKAQEAESYQLSSAQNRLYFLYEFDRASLAYNMPHVVRLTGELDKLRLVQAFKDLINRHESLRTFFEVKDGQPVQKVLNEVDFEIEFLQSNEQEARTVVNNFTRPFDLSKAPLIRVGLIEVGPRVHLLIVDMHHIIADGISLSILLRDFMARYNNNALAKLKFQYKDYAEWQQSDAQQAAIEKQRSFWINEFSSDVNPLGLPTDFARPLIKRMEGNLMNFNLNIEETRALKRIAEKESATLFMVILAAYNIFLSKISSVEDIVIGTPTGGRMHADLENVIGMFVNTIPIRNYPRGELKFDEFLANVKLKTLSCFDNQDYPYEELINELKVERDTSRNPLFDVMFSYQNFGQDVLSIPGLVLEQQDSGHRISKFDLLLTVFEGRDQLFLSFEYCTALFKDETISRFIEFFQKILLEVIENTKKAILDIEIISEKEMENMVAEFNRTKVSYPSDKTIIDIFAEQVQRTPNHIAIKFEDQCISYAELDRVSTKLAVLLKRHGINRDEVVGLLMDRSLETVIGMIAILKSGGAYLPIDIDYPDERINYLIKNSGATALLTSKRFKTETRYHDITLFIEDAEEIAIGKEEEIFNTNKPGDLCYVIYTSGTTGNPKGVMVEHLNVVRLFFNEEFQYDFGPNDVWTMFHSHCFDFSVWEIYGALLFGGKVVIIPKITARDTKAYLETLRKERVTILNQTPSAFYNLIKEEALDSSPTLNVRHVILGGESLSPRKLKSWRERYPHVKLINMYGITETTVFVTYKEIKDEEIENNISNIGKPIPTLSCYVFDRYRRLVPKGIIGELYIGGSGVTRGYLGNDSLTCEKFIQNPFNVEERLYRSGDLTKVLNNCDLEYIGRIDEQVQLRGFRIELGEIENQLLSHILIKEVVVLAKEFDGEKCLVAYYVSKDLIQASILRSYLLEKLPDYMVPSYYVHVKNLQLTVNGKLDKKTLPEWKVDIGSEYVTPISSIEKKLVSIWSEILKIDASLISINSNFFELGGHSIRAVHLMNRIQKDFSVRVELRNIFDAASIQKLCSLIEDSSTSEQLFLAPVAKKEYHPTSPAQERLFYNQILQKNSLKYNISVALEIIGKLDVNRLIQSFQLLINRHESLRTSFVLSEEGVLQRTNPGVVFELEILNENKYAGINDAYVKFVRAFELSEKSLMRCGLFSSAEKGNILFVDIHHIICDGISLKILINDFREIYIGLEIAPPSVTYIDYTYWLKSNKDKFEKHEKFWLNKLGGELPRLDLPVMRERASVDIYAASSRVMEIGNELYQDIKNCAATQRVSDFMFLLSIFYIMLSKMSGNKDVIVGTDVVGRTQAAFKDIVGTFINILPLRIQIRSDNSFAAFLKEVKNCVLEAFDHQDYQFNQIVALHGQKEKMSQSPIFDVHFSFANTIDSDHELNELELASIDVQRPETTQYELKLEGREHYGKMDVAFIYSTDLYSEKTIELFIEYYNNILTTVVRDPLIKISNIKMKTPVEYFAQNSGMQQQL